VSGRDRALAIAGIAAAAAILAWHVSVYFHLVDDAFISFRYARNLSDGHGLVFNPGHERVEGYTNFLWVLVLAAARLVGVRPEVAAPWLGIAATAALWTIVAREARRYPWPGGFAWLAIAPPVWLAATRSFAIWATSGLETRLFELFVVAGAFRLAGEIRARLVGRLPPRPVAALLFAGAALTRPDGVLMAAAALATAAAFLARRGKLDRAFWRGVVAAAAIVAAHFAFRRLYYGEWLPNTYYAKVGASRWHLGLVHHGAFLLEYAAWLWIPALVAAFRGHARRDGAVVPALAAAILVPHALWIARIGGDHFEYRAQDLAFPLVLPLVALGVAELFARRGRSVGAGLYAAAVLLGLWILPWQSRVQAPGRYLNGFPGRSAAEPEAVAFLDPDRFWLTRLPGFHEYAAAHRAHLLETTSHLVGVRQEEHRAFLAKVLPEARRLEALVASGVLPRDAHFATSCIGAIGFYSDLRIFDRHGLTDAGVARSSRIDPRGLVAHEKRATLEEARARGVDFWALDPVHSAWRRDDPGFRALVEMAAARGIPAWVADVGEGWSLLGLLPLGPERAAERLPRLELRPVTGAAAAP
jgi:arabinofuranosyltransferase